jgi:hypothetical protein
MVPIQLALLMVQVFLHGPPVLQDTICWPNRISTLECSILRKNTCQGFSKMVRGRFCYDAASGMALYDYSGPFHFRFIVSDTVVYAIDTKKNRGNAVRRGPGTPSCDDIIGSVHFFGAYLQCANAAIASVSLQGSIGPLLYFEQKTPSGSDVFARDRETGRIGLVERFDGQGAMYEQVKALFNEKDQVYEFPVRMIVRKKCNGVFTTDTVLISNLAVNRRLGHDTFLLPAGCTLRQENGAEQGAVEPDSAHE